MRVDNSPHLSVNPESVAFKYLEEKEEEYACLQEAHDKLTDALSDFEKVPAEISEKLKRLGDQLKELNQLLKDYRDFLKDVYI